MLTKTQTRNRMRFGGAPGSAAESPAPCQGAPFLVSFSLLLAIITPLCSPPGLRTTAQSQRASQRSFRHYPAFYPRPGSPHFRQIATDQGSNCHQEAGFRPTSITDSDPLKHDCKKTSSHSLRHYKYSMRVGDPYLNGLNSRKADHH